MCKNLDLHNGLLTISQAGAFYRYNKHFAEFDFYRMKNGKTSPDDFLKTNSLVYGDTCVAELSFGNGLLGLLLSCSCAWSEIIEIFCYL